MDTEVLQLLVTNLLNAAFERLKVDDRVEEVYVDMSSRVIGVTITDGTSSRGGVWRVRADAREGWR